ncbi:Ig-like domain-containing protein [Exiguobacterium sp. s191]|uniref:Ig-like domain-containing protein n=1 Tax=Exiguobacterium sp. s191 TaxID=2751196 RepID=UPI001BEA0D14|nr:Ig-like domain-containing protein [Exiguobacterium sp. s191]
MERFKRLFISTSLLIGAMQTGIPVTTNAFTQNEKVSPTSVSSGDIRPKAIQARDASDESGVGEKDATPPAPPVVNDITDQTTLVSGKVAPRATVILKIGTKSFGPVTASGTGEFEFIVDRQQAGLTAIVMVIDAEGNVSGESRMTVKDVTPPDAPQVDDVTDMYSYVTGKAEPGTTITVKYQTSIRGESVVGKDGRFKVPIYGNDANTTLTVTATDTSNHRSKETTIIVRDASPPSTPSVFFEVTDRTTLIKGRGSSGSVVYVKVDDKEIGYSPVESDSGYEVVIPPQKGGTRLKIMAVDRADNVSQVTEIIVKDTTAPSPPTVNDFSDHSTMVSGWTEPGAKVKVRVGKKIIGEKSAGKDGKYGIVIAKQKSGTELLVQSIDKAGNIGSPRKIIVLDKTPPPAPTMNPVSDLSTTISGRAEVGAKVFIKMGDNVIGSVIANKGAYGIKIIGLEAGTKLTVHAVDSSGNQSAKRQVTVSDRTPPMISSVSKLKRTDESVNGKAESDAKITVFRGSQKIGEGKVDGKGIFKVKIKKQKGGSVLIIRAQDKSGNRSKDKTIRVL